MGRGEGGKGREAVLVKYCMREEKEKELTLNFTCTLGKQIKTGRHHCQSERDCRIQY